MSKKCLYTSLLCVLLGMATGVTKAEQIWGEAERASSITAPLQIADDAAASGGAYITVAADNTSTANPPSTGIARYRIRVKEGGVYRMYLRVRCLAAGDENDSCWVRVQGATLNLTVAADDWIRNNNINYEVQNEGTQWFWTQVRHYVDWPGNDFVEMTMDPGTYTVEIAYREYGLHIDGFLLTNDPDVDPAALPDVIPFVPEGISTNPQPFNGETDVVRDVVLGWRPGEFANTHNVYIGTDFDDVNEATITDPLSATLVQGLEVDSYEPPDKLDFGTTYYWRVDEVNAPLSPGVFKGDVWSFTTEPLYYAVKNITVTASVPAGTGSGAPEVTVDGSGLTDGLYGIDDATMWVSQKTDDPIWLQYDFDRVYKLYGMHVWNYNGQFEFVLGFGFKDITIEYATEPDEWMTLGDYELQKATSQPGYAGQEVDLDGVVARSIRINVNRTHSAGDQAGLSEIRFLYKPLRARKPDPEPGSVDIDPSVVLSWRPGREAVSHEVHLGTDGNAVAAGEALVATVDTPSYDTYPLDLGLDRQYYWKIVEVNGAETPAAWASDAWSFSTPEYIVVDDFESYNDDNLIYEAWVDGFEIGSNGSQVGHDMPPYVEEAIVYSGSQSMPFQYGQNGATTSEAKLSLDSVQDWTQGAAQTLVLHFRGSLGNAAGQLYVLVNGTRVDYDGSAGSLGAPIWKNWNIDLASVGNVAKAVTSITIGVSGSGTGTLYFDDIRLYRDAPPATGDAVDPGTTNLMAYYPMSGNANDASGNGYDGTVETGSSFGAGPQGYGQAVVLDGASGHVTLPIGPLVQSLDSITVAAWVRRDGTGSWQRVFDFGNDTDVYMFLTTNADGGGVRFAITTGSAGGESGMTSAQSIPGDGTWHHVAGTIDGATGEMNLYVDGALVGSSTTTTLPKDLSNTTQNWIGRSQWDDPYLNGAVDEFRIYNRALTGAEIRYLVGDR